MDGAGITYAPAVPCGQTGPSHAFILVDRATGTRTIFMNKARVREMAEGGLPVSGMGDIVASMFVSPVKVGKFIWGGGPVFVLPTSANPALGASKWSAGPTIVILKQTGQWTYGALWNHLWSFAGAERSGGIERGDVSVSFLQPFVSYTTKNAVTLSVNAEATGNWKLYDRAADGSLSEKSGSQWTVPVHVGVAKLTKFGPFPFSIGANVGVFVAAPNNQPSWRLRMTGTILLPVR